MNNETAMNLSGADWVNLNRLLDQALDLEPEKRTAWIDSLAPEHAHLRETLRRLLLQPSGVETNDVLRGAAISVGSVPLPVAGDTIGPYKLLRELGSGGMATVWLAERNDGLLQRQVALKLPKSGWIEGGFNERMIRERDILASLEHPNIARLYDAGIDANGRPYLALEYVDGVPLDVYVREHVPTLKQRLQLFLEIARAIAFAHGRLIVHRDLKPNNILVKQDGSVRLLDFGIARLLRGDSADDRSLDTQFAARLFTPQYASPEQFRGKPITVATDVYSLGVLLYELLTGVSPYAPKRQTPAALEEVVLEVATSLPSSRTTSIPARALRGDLDRIVLKSLRKSPTNRYASVESFASDIECYLQGRPITAQPATRWYLMTKFVRRHLLQLTAAFAVTTALIVGLSVALVQRQEAELQRQLAEESLGEMEATVDFTTTILTESTSAAESITLEELLARSETIAARFGTTDVRSRVAAALFLSRWYISYGQFDKAEKILTKTIQEVPDDVGVRAMSEVRCKRAGVWGHLGREKDAEAAFDAEMQRVAARNDPASAAYCLLTRAQWARESDNVTGAHRYTIDALHHYEHSGRQSPYDYGELLGEVAISYSRIGQLDRASEYFKRALSVFEKAGRAESSAAFVLLNNWSTAEYIGGNPRASAPLIERAVAISRKRSPDGQPAQIPLGNYGSTLVALGRYEEATRALDQQKVLAAEENDQASLLYGLLARVNIATNQNDSERAQSLLDQAAQDLASNKQLVGEVRLSLSHKSEQGLLWLKVHRYADADKVLTEAIDQYEALKCCARAKTKALLTRAEARWAQKQFDLAVADAKLAQTIAIRQQGSSPYSDLTGMALRLFADIELQRASVAEAKRLYSKSIEHLSNTVADSHPELQRAQKSLAAIGTRT